MSSVGEKAAMKSPVEFADDYCRRLITALREFDRTPIEPIVEVLIEVAERGGVLWIGGNGGSAAIADHAVCDMTKGTFVDGRAPLRSVSLVADGPMITALANDISYERIFREQLVYCLRPEDAVLLVSSSGDSPNVVEACRYARQRGVPTIAFVGFEGGRLASLADHCVHVAVDDYGVVEDAHQAVMHAITQYLRARAEHAG